MGKRGSMVPGVVEIPQTDSTKDPRRLSWNLTLLLRSHNRLNG